MLEPLYTAAEMRAAEARYPGFPDTAPDLMDRAGRAVATLIGGKAQRDQSLRLPMRGHVEGCAHDVRASVCGRQHRCALQVVVDARCGCPCLPRGRK